MTTADRAIYWFTKVYGLGFEGAHRLAEYEAATDEFHAVRVLLLVAGSKCTFEEAVIAVAITDSDFDREELAEVEIEPVCLGVCESYCPDCNAFCLPPRTEVAA